MEFGIVGWVFVKTSNSTVVCFNLAYFPALWVCVCVGYPLATCFVSVWFTCPPFWRRIRHSLVACIVGGEGLDRLLFSRGFNDHLHPPVGALSLKSWVPGRTSPEAPPRKKGQIRVDHPPNRVQTQFLVRGWLAPCHIFSNHLLIFWGEGGNTDHQVNSRDPWVSIFLPHKVAVSECQKWVAVARPCFLYPFWDGWGKPNGKPPYRGVAYFQTHPSTHQSVASGSIGQSVIWIPCRWLSQPTTVIRWCCLASGWERHVAHLWGFLTTERQTAFRVLEFI